ncbi:MAG: LPS assembly protein LptD [Rickettsia endosymbiont of Bryobia graminum]|nr:LPS assembly protein LptD [Rickettsia endosymbiont of Bryobia graminum]
MRIFCYLLTIITILFPVVIISDVKKSETGKPFNFLSTDYVEYNKEQQLIYARGNVEVILEDYFLTANTLIYDIKNDKLWAEGNVMIKDEKSRVILGETAILKDKLKAGIISDFILYFGDNTLLVSKLAERVSDNLFYLTDSTFTPCKILCNNKPIWQVSAKKTRVDLDNSLIVYRNLFFEVWGVPILYTPYFSHPTPKAKAKSGILVPQFKNKALGVPLYYIALPNLDFTLTPRFFGKYSIYEIEARYKPNKTDYITVEASYGKVPYRTQDGNILLKNRNVNSYYIFSNGAFSKENYQYGFRIEHASDQAYLKNYYKNYTSSLTSKIYFHKINKYNYLSLEGIYLEGLNVNDSSNTNPLIYPKIRTKNVINLNDSETSKLIIENNTLVYKERNSKELGRTAIQIALDNSFLTSTGHLFNFIARNRTDIYFISHTYHNDLRANKLLTRNIPEIQNIWRYPLASSISKKSTLMVEPIISITFGRKHNSNTKFSFIDYGRYELSENNFFLDNHYSGIDHHKFGNRLSYGINSSLLSGQNYFSLFLGQTYNKGLPHNSIHYQENVGKISSNFSNNLELFYRFRKNQHFEPIRDEIGGTLSLEKLQFTTAFIQIKGVKKYYSIDNKTYDRLRQVYYNLSYQLTDTWSVSYGMRLDVPKTKLSVLSQSIRVTYQNDCVRISTQLSDDYMVDTKRGIKKTSLPTVTIGLKILNM